MGFGKFLVGGVCAVGAVVAAPVILPAAGFAVAGSTITGAAGLTAGMALAGVSPAAAAVAAGTAGVVVADAMEDKKEREKRDLAYERGIERGSAGKEEMRKAQEKEREGWKEEIDRKKEYIKNQNDYIKNQDDFINAGLWDDVKECLKKVYSSTDIFEKYIKDTEYKEEVGNKIKLQAADKETALYLKQYCNDEMLKAVKAIYGDEGKEVVYGYLEKRENS